MQHIFMYSDPHFGHSNIIDYENRPFKDIDEQDKILIKNWNEVVRPSDKVFVLGDFSFYGKDKTSEILSKLNGIKELELGNHDLGRTSKWWKDVGFSEVHKYPIIFNKYYILSHEPIYLNQNMPYANIHGHIHSQKFESKQFFNVSVECIDYKPINFEDIEAYYAKENL